MNKPWDAIISRKDQEAFRAAGFGGCSGLRVRSELLIIDSSGLRVRDLLRRQGQGSSADTQPAFPKY